MNQFRTNREKLYNDLKPGDIAVFFAGIAPASTADSLYPFRTDKNFYYFTGLKREGFILVMCKDEEKISETLFVTEPNEDREKWLGRTLSKESCTKTSDIADVLYTTEFENFMNRTVYTGAYKKVHLDLARIHSDRDGLYAHSYSKKLQLAYPQLRIMNAHKHLRKYRLIKSEEEVMNIRRAIDLTKNGLERVMTKLKPGDFEYAAQAEFNYSIMKHGADGNAFETIAASGINATILHYIENDHRMKDGALILMDLGAQYGEYASDITRTYPVNGQFSQRQKELYNLVLKAHDAVIEMMTPGTAFVELNMKSSEVLLSGLKEMGIVKEDTELSNYYYHGVSHFLGLDTHDLGERETTLKPGMVLTVEPGLYIAEESIGIRIEDDVLITESGNEVLSKDIIRTVEDIEGFMAK